MEWAREIKKIAIGVTDYGSDFNVLERKEYSVVTFDNDGKMDRVPGFYESRVFARKAVDQLAKRVKEVIGYECEIQCKDIPITATDSGKQKQLKERIQMTHRKITAACRQRRIDNGGRG
jgi:hypothetical protein